MKLAHKKVSCNRILVIDDDPEELFATCRVLQKAGYVVEGETSSEKTFGKAKEFHPDLILLDVVMPVLDGFEVCRRLKSDQELKKAFVILMSGIKKTPDYKAKGLNAGADGFVARPFHTDEFLSHVASILRIKTVEKELRTQRQWLRITLSSIGDGLIATDEAGRVLFINPVAERLTGWAAEDARYKDIGEVFKVVDETTGRPISSPIAKVLREGRVIQLDDNALLIRKDHERIPVADSAAPILNDDDQLTGGVLIFRDLTEKRTMDHKMRQMLNEWGTMFRAIGQMTLIIDPHHGILDANDIALVKTGWTREQIIGKKCFEVIHGSVEPPKACPMVKTLKSGRQESSPVNIEKIEGDYLVSCTPVMDTSGRIDKIVHIATDISVLKSTQRALEESEDKYRTLFKLSSDAVILYDHDSKQIMDANKAAEHMYGYNYDRLLSLTMTDISAEKNGIVKPNETPFYNELPIHYHYRKDGSVFPVEITQNIMNIHGKKVVLSSIRDISRRVQEEKERKSLEEQVRQAQKMEAMGTLSGGIAHDFNNILGIIVGNAELAMLDTPEWSPARESLEEIRKASLRARDLISQILVFARQKEQIRSNIRVDPVAKESLKMLRATIPTTVEIHQTIAEDLPPVYADPAQIQQIIMNLCANAGQAMEADGGRLDFTLDTIEIETPLDAFSGKIAKGLYVRMSIRDTGPGIEPGDLEHIFDPFFTTKGVGEGTGLGLAVVHGIVQEQHGGIAVETEKGIGTTFTVYLPASGEGSTEDPLEEQSELPRGKERVLFVDDEPMIVTLGQRMLERQGYEVETLSSGTDALDRFKRDSNRFDLVVTDMTMPGMRGDQLAKEMLKIRPDIPVILSTGFNHQISEKKAKEIGVRAFVMKPLTAHDLTATVRRVLDEK